MRLYDRLQLKGGAVMHPKHIERGEAEITELREAPVMVLDNATRFFYEVSGRDEWRTGVKFPPFFPPFEKAFFETRAPRQVLDSRGVSIFAGEEMEPAPPGVSRQRWMAGIGDGIPEWWGYYIRCRDLKRETKDTEDWPRSARREVANAVKALEAPGLAARRAITGQVRWLIEASFYLEGAAWARKLVPVRQPVSGPAAGFSGGDYPIGPLAGIVLGVLENGELARYAGGEDRVRVGQAFFGGREVAPKDQELVKILGTNALHLLNPVIFGMALLNCENVAVMREGPTKQKAQKDLKRKGRRPTDYYTLDIEPMKELLRHEGQVGKVGVKRAFHLVRGHIRTYDPERGGLFGRPIVERESYFIPPHKKGDKKVGRIEKRYNVDGPAADKKPEFKIKAPGKIARPAERPKWGKPDIGRPAASSSAPGESETNAGHPDATLEAEASEVTPSDGSSTNGTPESHGGLFSRLVARFRRRGA